MEQISTETNFILDSEKITKKFISGGGPILVVDDDEDQQYVVRRCYEKSNKSNELVFLQNAKELIEFMNQVLQNNKPMPELILLDINMPGANGFDALKEIKMIPEFKKIPIIIMFTASEAKQDIELAKTLGANAFWTKPLEIKNYIKFFNDI